MSGRIIQTLTEQERRSLSICGITQDEQLAACSPAGLAADLKLALGYFPDVYVISLPRLEDIHRRAAAAVRELPQPMAEPGQTDAEKGVQADADLPPLQRPAADPQSAVLTEDFREASPVHHTHGSHHTAASYRASGEYDHAIRNTRLFTIWIGAWLTLLFPCALMGLAALLVCQFCLNIHLPGESLKTLMYTCLSVVGLYFIFMNLSLCSVCHMKLFTFRHYARNRMAHRLPLLGSCLATALRIAFTMRFRCPACGTLQELTHTSHR